MKATVALDELRGLIAEGDTIYVVHLSHNPKLDIDLYRVFVVAGKRLEDITERVAKVACLQYSQPVNGLWVPHLDSIAMELSDVLFGKYQKVKCEDLSANGILAE